MVRLWMLLTYTKLGEALEACELYSAEYADEVAAVVRVMDNLYEHMSDEETDLLDNPDCSMGISYDCN
jgi:hypothetical protein